MENVTSFICSAEGNFPFLFYDENKEIVNGTLTEDNFCIFPTANCNPDTRIADCCSLNSDSDIDMSTASKYAVIGNVFTFATYGYCFYALYRAMTPEEWEKMAKEFQQKPKLITEIRYLPNFFKDFLMGLYEAGYFIFIGALVTLPIFIKQTQQRWMTPSERNSLASAQAFMEPYFIIFTFVEDIVMVRVMFAMASGDRELTNDLVHTGIAGVIVAGVLGGIFSTLCGVITPVLEALTMPGVANDQKIYQGCLFVETVDVESILPYWLMESWELVAKQISSVLAGFLVGAFQMDFFGWAASIGMATLAGIWFGLGATADNPITIYGAAEFAADWASLLAIVFFIVSPIGEQVRDQTGLKLSFKRICSILVHPLKSLKRSQTLEETDDQEQEGDMTLIADGLKLMTVDIIIQGCLTCSTYMALTTDGAVAYQMTALQSEIPQYGPAYALGIGIIFKIFGPIFLAKGFKKDLAGFILVAILCGFLLNILVYSLTLPFLQGLAYNSGTNACAYASSEECVPYFNEIFGPNSEGGKFTLFFTYYAFPLACTIETFLFIIRSILTTLLDLDFMFYTSIAAGLVYVPVIGVVYFGPFDFQQQAIGYFVSYYVPQAILGTVFLGRAIVLCLRLYKDTGGPWDSRNERRNSTMLNLDKDIAAKAIASAQAEADAANYDLRLNEERDA